jgi:O-antigen/teichoic acid export membrane protein
VRGVYSLGLSILQSAWSALLAIALIPVYIKFLGLQSYGIIGLYGSLLALMLFFDFGATATISRKAAVLSSQGDLAELGRLSACLSMFVWVIAGLLALAGLFIGSSVTKYWLRGSASLMEVLPSVMAWLFLAATLRLPINYYHGILIGLGRLNSSSIIHIVAVTFGGLMSVLGVALLDVSIVHFFQIQFFVNLLHVTSARVVVAKYLPIASWNEVSFFILRNVFRFSLTMTLVSGTGLIFMHSDKFLLGSLVSIEQLGAYSAASALAMGIFVLVGPSYNLLYPTFSRLIAAGEDDKAAQLYFSATCLIFAGLLPIVLTLAVNSGEILFAWTANPDLTTYAATSLSILSLGFLANGVMYPMYALQLAYGRADLALKINLALLLLFVPLAYTSAQQWGITGTACSWLLVAVMYLCSGTFVTLKILKLRVKFSEFLIKIALPFFLICAIVFLIRVIELANPIGMYAIAFTLFVSLISAFAYIFIVKASQPELIHLKHSLRQHWIEKWKKNT